jgi:hypothetical protein
MPWEPDAYKTGRVEYLEEELNQLMSQKKMNEDSAKEYFNKRVVDSKQKAIEENKRKAQETGNKLTQCIDKEGNLKGVGYTSQMAELNEDATSADVKKVLFEQEISK